MSTPVIAPAAPGFKVNPLASGASASSSTSIVARPPSPNGGAVKYWVQALDAVKYYWFHITIFIWLLILTIIIGVYFDKLIKKTSAPSSTTPSSTTPSSTTPSESNNSLSDGFKTWIVILSFGLVTLLVFAFLYLRKNIVVEERPYIFIMIHFLLFVSILATSVNVIKKINS